MNRFEKALDRIKKNVTPQDDWDDSDFEQFKAVCDALIIAAEQALKGGAE